ncbi:MAG: molecular chaperone DnaK [Ardenticatenia bacterium]|nr:molecular chaperone DnaK [Ardenticatenia bacterium]
MARVLGIDLGTTNSVMAVLEGGEPVIIPNAEGHRLTPSIVAISPKTGERLVGLTAKRQAVVNPQHTILSIKRFMGRRYRDPEAQAEARHVAYEVREALNGDVRVVLGGREYAPPEISAMILQKLRRDAEVYLGEEITQAVITVPAYFDDAQRQATKDAGRIAGLEVLRIINEPTASALAYGLGRQKEQRVAVYDLGGGTFDISILDIGEGVYEVLATAGDTHLGGNDFDQRIVDWAVEAFRQQEGVDLHEDSLAMQRLREAAERAKVELSSVLQTDINLPFITADASGPKHLELTLTRAHLEAMVDDLIARTLEPVRQALKDAGLAPDEVDTVILVGGQTRMPAVQRAVAAFFGQEPHRSLNPDEVVALGAAIQAGVLAGEVKDVLLLDVTPLTLGLETAGGVATPLIPRGTTIPTRKTQLVSTVEDNQRTVRIHVVQGERPLAADNRSLGHFELRGIRPAKRGEPRIEVTFDIDADGILHVSAKDLDTGQTQGITITGASGLRDEVIAEMIRHAQEAEAEDRRRLDMVLARNKAETVLYRATRVRHLLHQRGHQDETAIQQLHARETALRDALADPESTADHIRALTNELAEALSALGPTQAKEDDMSPKVPS